MAEAVFRSDEHADAATRARIKLARRVRGIPRGARIIPESEITVAGAFEARARAAPERPFLHWRAEDPSERFSWSFGQFQDLVARTARYLQRSLGLRRGDRLATFTSNHPSTVLAYFAAWRLGLTVVPVNVNEDDARVRFILENAGARALLARPDLCERAEGAAAGVASLEHLLALDLGPGTACSGPAPAALPSGLPARFGRLSEALSGALSGAGGDDLSTLPLPGPEDEALIVYTSGTTGPPKGVSLDQYDLAVDAASIARWHSLDPASRLMCVLPIHHVNGIVVTLVTPAIAGASVVLCPRFRTGDFWPALAEHRVQIVSVVPTLLQFLLEAGGDLSSLPLESFHYPICGAGPLTVDLAVRFEERFGRRVLHGYGLSETTCYSSFLPADLPAADHARWIGDFGFPSIGLPVAANEMAIHDEKGSALPAGARGEIVIRGHNVMRHYHRRPDANAETFAHGWFRSGDEGFFQPGPGGEEFFFITGRIKEIIIRGGVKIAPFEVDEVLMSLPGVKAGLAVGFENRYYGEEVGAYVARAAGPEGGALTEETVLAWCRARLPFHKIPKAVVFGEEIPVTSTGKYQRGKLKHLFQRWAGAQFRDR